MSKLVHRLRSTLSFAAMIALLVVAPARAQEGDAPTPPPADPPAEEAPATPEPQSLQPAPAPAPPPPTGAAIAPGLKGGPAFTWGDSTGVVLPPLAEIASPAELDAQYESWRTLRGKAEMTMLKSRERSLRWKSQAELQKSHIELLGKQVDAAKKEKREADRKDYEAAKKREEKKREYFDSMRQVMEATAEFNKAQFELCQSRMTQIEQEKKLHELWSKGGYESRISPDARAQEQTVITMSKDHANKLSSLADKERALADKALNALKLWAGLQK